MQDRVWNISFHNRLYDYRENGGIRLHKTLSTSSYPFEVRLKRDGILMPKCLAVNHMYHTPSLYEPFTVTLNIILIAKGDSLNKCIMRTIPSRITKLS